MGAEVGQAFANQIRGSLPRAGEMAPRRSHGEDRWREALALARDWMRNARSYVPKGQQSMASAALRQAFIQPDRAAASQTLRHVADQLRVKWPKLGAFIDDSEIDVLSHMDFPAKHRSKIHSTNLLERLNKMGYPAQ